MSKKNQVVINILQERGCKITAVRRALLEIFLKKTKPVTAGDIIGLLGAARLQPHKTTVYRELDFLIKQKLIREVVFDDGQIRYEYLTRGHYHYLICLTCKQVDKVELTDDLDKEERAIERKMKFKVKRHSLEFYGLCGHCQ